MKTLPLHEHVTRQQAVDLLNFINSLIERYFRFRYPELDELYHKVSKHQNEFIGKALKVQINNFYNRIHNEFRNRYKQVRAECEERQFRINQWLTIYKDQIPPGFPKSPIMPLEDCINVFYHNNMLMQYEIEFQNMVLLENMRQEFLPNKESKSDGNITYLFSKEK